MTHSDESSGTPAGGHQVPPRVARSWIRVIVFAAAAAYVLAISGLAKARDEGGTGFQVFMVVLTGVVLLVALVLRRRAIGAGAEERGQHITWLVFIRLALVAGIILAVVATIRSTPQQQTLPAIVAAVNLWLLSIVIRLDSAARHAAAVGSPS